MWAMLHVLFCELHPFLGSSTGAFIAHHAIVILFSHTRGPPPSNPASQDLPHPLPERDSASLRRIRTASRAAAARGS